MSKKEQTRDKATRERPSSTSQLMFLKSDVLHPKESMFQKNIIHTSYNPSEHNENIYTFFSFYSTISLTLCFYYRSHELSFSLSDIRSSRQSPRKKTKNSALARNNDFLHTQRKVSLGQVRTNLFSGHIHVLLHTATFQHYSPFFQKTYCSHTLTEGASACASSSHFFQ